MSAPSMRACRSSIQWDDHEVVNNWSGSKDLSADERYKEKSVPLLDRRAGARFPRDDAHPHQPEEPGRVYRKISYGPLLDIFFLDLRSYRGPNGASLETETDAAPHPRRRADALAQA